MVMVIRLLPLCLLTFALLAAPLAATGSEPLAQVNRTTLVEGDTVTLRVRTRDTLQDIDLAPLRSDFEVVTQRQSTNNPALTGLGTEFQEWEIVLRPRRTGELTIPSLSVGSQRTRSIDLRVLTISPEQRAVMDQHVSLDVEIAKDSLYVGEPTLVTLTLYYNVNINGTFADITPTDSEWEPLGDRITGTTETSDGSQFNYTRFKYLYTPLSSGPRQLPAFEFEGDYRTHSLAPRRALNDVTSDPIDLDVKPVPEDFPDGYAWLPARDLQLTETWSDNGTDLTLGDQIERQVQMQARGPAAANLPTLLGAQSASGNVRQYPGSPSSREELLEEDRISERTETVSYLITEPGEQPLPEIRVPWWDVETDALCWETLPARTVTVGAALESVDMPAAEQPPGEGTTQTRPWYQSLWVWVGVAVLALGIAFRHRLVRRLGAFRRPFTQAPSGVAPTPEPTTRPRRTPLAAGKPRWIKQARMAAQQADWRHLIGLLGEHLADQGWPDTRQVEKAVPVPGLHQLVKRTQGQLYGKPEDRIADDTLIDQWLELLEQWPKQNGNRRQTSAANGLYPDD